MAQPDVYAEISRKGKPAVTVALDDYLDMTADDLAGGMLTLYVRDPSGAKLYVRSFYDLCDLLRQPIPPIAGVGS